MEISQDATSHLLKALEHHFLLIKAHSYKTLNAFYCHIFLNHTGEVIQTLPNYFWQLSPLPLSLVVKRTQKT